MAQEVPDRDRPTGMPPDPRSTPPTPYTNGRIGPPRNPHTSSPSDHFLTTAEIAMPHNPTTPSGAMPDPPPAPPHPGETTDAYVKRTGAVVAPAGAGIEQSFQASDQRKAGGPGFASTMVNGRLTHVAPGATVYHPVHGACKVDDTGHMASVAPDYTWKVHVADCSLTSGAKRRACIEPTGACLNGCVDPLAHDRPSVRGTIVCDFRSAPGTVSPEVYARRIKACGLAAKQFHEAIDVDVDPKGRGHLFDAAGRHSRFRKRYPMLGAFLYELLALLLICTLVGLVMWLLVQPLLARTGGP